MRVKALLGGAGCAALLLFASAPVTAQPYGGGDCRDRIERAERHLDRAIDRFGRHSEAARDARHDLENVRDWCRHRHDRYDGHDRDRHDRY